MKAIVSEKGQVTLPKPIRDRLGLYPGVTIDFEDSEGRLIGRKVLAEDPVQSWIGKGHLPGHLSVDAYLKKVRGDNSR